MTAPVYTGYQQSLSYSAAKDRYVVTGPMARRATANPISGVILQATGAFSASRTGFNVTVTHGAAVVSPYWFIANGNTTLTIEPVTGTARRDLIIARVYDIEAGNATSEGKLEIVKGTTTADPTVPSNSLILHQVDVPASGTALVLTDRRTFTAAAGAVKPVFGISSLVVADQTPGMPIYDLNTDIHWNRWRSDTTNLHRMGAVQVAAGMVNSNTTVEVRNTWYYKQFGPIVLPQPANIVVVQGTFTLTFITDAATDLAGAFGNTEVFHTVVTGYGSTATSNGDRTYSFTGTIKDRAAGSHDLCWLGLMSGAGAVVHVKNLSYSWVAYG
jgi:hypothetical protein